MHTASRIALPNAESLLYLWEDRSLYLTSTVLPVRNFKTAADIFIVYLEGESHLELFSGKNPCIRSVLLKAGHFLAIENTPKRSDRVAIIYLDPFGQDFSVLRQRMKKISNDVYVTHQDEGAIIAKLQFIRETQPSRQKAQEMLSGILSAQGLSEVVKTVDPRIAQVVALIKDTSNRNLSLDELAESVHLSSSRLCKLFKQQLGIPIRRYRLWHRLYLCSNAYARGFSMLDSALMAGFSSQSHYTTAFSRLLGLNPTDLLSSSKYIKILW